MDMSDACDQLAETILSEKFLLVHPGWSIQRFCCLIEGGETPKMALSIVKKEAEKG